MAATPVAATWWVANTRNADTAGTTIVPGNTPTVITPLGPLEEMMIRIVHTYHGAETATIYKGTNPPADSAPADMTVTLADATAGDITYWIGPLSSTKYLHHDGTVVMDFGANATGTIAAFQMSRKA
jgi:hypothetical protein